MILLITASARSREYAAAIAQGSEEKVVVAANARKATGQLGASEFTLLVIDQSQIESEPRAVNVLLSRAGTAMPLYISLAICSPERLRRDVQAALKRRQLEQRLALQSARSLLNSQLNGAVTGILLSSQLALNEPELPPAALKKLKSVYDLAMQMRSQLRVSAG